jgi:hypothetical protein
MELMDTDLVVGKTYEFTHTRKGKFKAQLIDILPGDEADARLLKVKIDTRRGRGQERLARVKTDVTVTNLRPSLISEILQCEDEAWLIEKRVPEELSREERDRRTYETEQKRLADTIARTVVSEMKKPKGNWRDLFRRKSQ